MRPLPEGTIPKQRSAARISLRAERKLLGWGAEGEPWKKDCGNTLKYFKEAVM